MLFHNDKKQLFIINVLLNMLFKIKNKISYKVLALLWMMTASVCLVACGGDDEPKEPSAGYKSVNANYVVNLSQDYLNLYDVEATYSFDNETHTEAITSTQWEMVKKFTSNQPKHFTCTVKASPKATVPHYADDAKITISENYELEVTGVDNGGNVMQMKSLSNSHTLNTTGKQLQTLLEKGERSIVKFDYTR